MVNKFKLLFGSGLAALVLAVASVGVASATPKNSDNVTICHRTNSVTNPYVRETVDPDSADGNTSNDNGKGDHSEHTGPVASTQAQAQALKDAKIDWGDIIPPHDNYGGLNWDAQGQAVYNNDCNYVVGGQGGGETPGTTTTTTTTTPTGGRGAGQQQVATTPAGGVGAGAGSAKSVSAAGVAGLAGSVASLTGGLLWTLKRRAL